MNEDSAVSRRPLKSRSSAWAGQFSRFLLGVGLKPNTVSLLSVGCAGIGGASAWMATQSTLGWFWWIVAAAGIQLRLVCNLMDGLLAVEGGLKSPTGELFNEIPDRVADLLVLVPLGYATGTAWGIGLGWSAGAGAILTAYIRALGASLTGQQDFCGPMAKPQRMAAATVACLGMLVLGLLQLSWPLLVLMLVVVNLGIVMTAWRRIVRMGGILNASKAG